MAKQRIIHLIDDLDGGTADETIRFAIDEQIYEIDLSVANARELRRTFKRYQEGGRKIRPVKLLAAGERPTRPRRRASNGDAARVREWAKAHGYGVQPSGRVPNAILDLYREATRSVSAAA